MLVKTMPLKIYAKYAKSDFVQNVNVNIVRYCLNNKNATFQSKCQYVGTFKTRYFNEQILYEQTANKL